MVFCFFFLLKKYRKVFKGNLRKVVIVGLNKKTDQLRKYFNDNPDYGYQLIKTFDLSKKDKIGINDVISFISENEKQIIAQKMAHYSGLSEKSILQHNLDIPTRFFWKELLRDKTGQTMGRLDSRYLGLDKTEAGSSPDYSPELTSWMHSFTPAINYYIREQLNFKTDVKYNMFGDVNPWNRENNNVRDGLRQAMAKNPYLKVLIQSGYYDGATTYFGAKYTMWQIDPSGKMKDRFTFKGYRSGHMMYLRKDDLISANDDLRVFINNSLSKGKAAKYTKD